MKSAYKLFLSMKIECHSNKEISWRRVFLLSPNLIIDCRWDGVCSFLHISNLYKFPAGATLNQHQQNSPRVWVELHKILVVSPPDSQIVPQHYFHPNLANGHQTMLIWSTWNISQFCERGTCWFWKLEKFFPANQIFVNCSCHRFGTHTAMLILFCFTILSENAHYVVLYMQIFWAMHWCVH